ncbi:MAG: hypothetical protein ABIG63_03350, partial [Chloroflexota bacterium]
ERMAAKGDNIEKFAFMYEYDAKPLEGGLKKATSSVDGFVHATTKGLTSMTGGVMQTTKSLQALGGKKTTTALGRVLGSLTGIAKKGYDLFQVDQRIHSMGTGLKSILKMGGLAVIFGPFLPLIKPFMMLVGLITDTLQPAIDLLENSVKGALAPLSMALYDLTMKILPHLMKVIDPIVGFLIEGVEMLGEMFDEDLFGDLAGIFDEILPLVRDISVIFVRDFLKPVGGILFKTVIQMFKQLVTFATAFVKEIKPYLPEFFNLLQKIAGLLIGSVGDIFKNLMENLTKKLPDIMALFKRLITAFTDAFPSLKKLVPEIVTLITNLLNFFTEATLVLTEKIVDAIVKAIKESPALIDKLTEMAKAGADMFNTKDVTEFMQLLRDTLDLLDGISKFFGDFVVAWDELVRLTEKVLQNLGLMKKEKTMEDSAAAARLAQATAMVKEAKGAIKPLTDAEITSMLKEVYGEKRGVSLSDAVVREHRLMLKERQKAVEMARFMQGTAMEGHAEGGYITSKRVVTVAEAGPEWIVPDTPVGIKSYVPKMIDNVFGKGAASVPQAEATARVSSDRISDQILRAIHRTLIQIEQILESQGDESMLPEAL